MMMREVATILILNETAEDLTPTICIRICNEESSVVRRSNLVISTQKREERTYQNNLENMI